MAEMLPLALFPLHRVLLPGEIIVLQVFEPRYHQMLEDLDGDRFGVVLIRSGSEVGGGADYHGVGTVAVIRERRDAEDGRVFIAAQGEHRFEIDRHLDRNPYPEAMVSLLPADGSSQPLDDLRDEVAGLFRTYQATLAEAGYTSDIMVDLPDEPEATSFAVASRMRLAAPEVQDLLEAGSTQERLERERMVLGKEIELLRNIWGANG